MSEALRLAATIAALRVQTGAATDFWSLPAAEQLKRIEDERFPAQTRFVRDGSRFLAALCTRRAGKTNGLAAKYIRAGVTHPNCMMPYIAMTRDSAKNIMWPVLQELDERFKLGIEFKETDLTATLKNGASIKLFGADMKNFIKRLKGIKTPFVAVDEAQDFGAHIRELVDDVLTPTIADYRDGALALTGTPGPVPVGLFYEVTHARQHGYSVHRWSIFENPYMPDARAFVDDLRRKKAWDDQNPTYRREWLGEWVLDLEALVFQYAEAKNHYDTLPAVSGEWDYVIGVDLGFDDADAIAVVGWHPRVKEAYLVDELVQRGQGITELAHQLAGFIDKYKPLRVVMDTGGLGKKIAEEISKRHGLPIRAAEKDRKFEFIELLNDALRTRRLFAKRDSIFAHDCARVKWDSDSVKPKISDVFHSDITDAVTYAYREALHWLSEPEVARAAAGTPEWYNEQEKEMQRQAEETLQRSQLSANDMWGDMNLEGWV